MRVIKVSKSKGVPKYRQIVHSIENALDSGALKKSDKLPSVNSIRNEFSLSRDTVFKAFNELKKRGIIESVAGKGYYIKSEDVNVSKKVFLLFDELNAFKEDLYNAFLSALDTNVQVDIFFHHFNEDVFEKYINDSSGSYNYYVIMPANLKNVSSIVSPLPKDKVYILDQTNTSLDDYASVFQNFESNVYKGLTELKSKLKTYKQLIFVNPKSNQPEGILNGFNRFVEANSIRCNEISDVSKLQPRLGDVYFVLDDRSLIELIKKIQIKELIIGKDVGIIAYNDSLLKEIVVGGITTISTNFKLMGEQMAKIIMNEEHAQVENPNEVIIRKSL
ncbi:GntR family transcriptional regulator [Winogradskyella sp. A3E31]|uniref:GntR family transcriptional regulator n=1 Tax=Winogradskyella sp. A3E31 TaxID=3349637 RepID=UPI00398B3B88